MPRASSSREPDPLGDRLRARRAELEQAVLTRVHAIADPKETADPAYAGGLRSAISAALDYGLAALEQGEGRLPQVPPSLLVQGRLAARNGVSLKTVLRRYAAGYALLGDRVIDEAHTSGIPSSDLKRLHRLQAVAFDHLIAAVSEEYAREADARPETTEQRRADLVERLLAGELLDVPDLAYSFDCWHLGLLVVGPDPSEVLCALGKELDRTLLIVGRSEETVWAWLGGRRPFDPDQISSPSSFPWPLQVRVALGAPAEGLPGWRLTHRQAVAALPIALRGEQRVAHYAQAPLLATALQDELLATTLHKLYLDPLRQERDGGLTAKNTLRAYFEAGGNVSSAAAALGVNRATVRSRLSAIEERFGRSLETASAEIETALRLDEVEAFSP